LDLKTNQWTLVDNYGDIPGVRMGMLASICHVSYLASFAEVFVGHTATLYQGDKLLIFGGENEHRAYLSDLIIFDLKTAHWTQPNVNGPLPKGRARHAAVLHEDKLFIVGGISGQNNYVLDDICYLDLKTMTWSRSWKFVGRFDHAAWIWGGRMWVFGGLSEEMDKSGQLWWLDLKGSPAFESPPTYGISERRLPAGRRDHTQPFNSNIQGATGSSGYTANSSSVQVNPPSFSLLSTPPVAPGAISSVNFVSGPNIPSQGAGGHFHVYSSGCLLDFVTPATTTTPQDCSLSALELDTHRWQKLAEGREIFKANFRWHYCTINEEGTKAWLLGCPTENANDMNPSLEEYLSDVMEIDLRRYGLLGNSLAPEPRPDLTRLPAADRLPNRISKGLGADLAKMFDQPPSSGNGTDFTITAEADEDGQYTDTDTTMAMSSASSGRSTEQNTTWLSPTAPTSAPIHVHKLILQCRWPHFARLYNAQMAEFHTKKMHIPEPYTVVRAFLYYLYTDSIDAPSSSAPDGVTPTLDDVAGMLVLANIYDLPCLRLLCVHRLARELDVDHACLIWERASTANEEWLRKRAATFCLMHWGRVVRTLGFRHLPRQAMADLCAEVDADGRVVGGEELEIVGGLGGGQFGVGGLGVVPKRGSLGSEGRIELGEEVEDGDVDDEGMEMT
jgi:hypothetical protein